MHYVNCTEMKIKKMAQVD